jgi:gamma-glutamylcyclotransferase (GGCT)/AIG2-like uncharacterized protein YtfP
VSSSTAPAHCAPRLFVYGTLKTGFDNRWAKALRQSAAFLGPARLRGRLYRVAHYPGVKRCAHGNSWVLGELFRLHNPGKLLQALDQYEGERFKRVRALVYLEEGGRRACWTYEYVPRVGSSREIVTGRFNVDAAGLPRHLRDSQA